jgi:hypothetical protein
VDRAFEKSKKKIADLTGCQEGTAKKVHAKKVKAKKEPKKPTTVGEGSNRHSTLGEESKKQTSVGEGSKKHSTVGEWSANLDTTKFVRESRSKTIMVADVYTMGTIRRQICTMESIRKSATHTGSRQ